ncbi:carboxymuconolactone decarboxylase family protein [Methylobacterium sp. E-005]|uniref:carboxymuconolactone decarboxylase family protein n=1 Tax=Methylobacterium sp. E-005 TaxID=2836549 RepID=UPI001FBA4E6C|nr:carboxymuconolactone decarboxylase family protein [Methylobacterium sp. E-005]MCJ2088305.1 carboxymuconolactone decarboxylase family protein [Methylobacterium sp. E-005]
MRFRRTILALVALPLATLPLALGAARAQDRLPTIPPQDYTPEQKQAAESFAQARGKPPFGPFEPLMYSPEVMTLARSMGDYLRFKPKIGTTLSELVILMTARRWTQDYEWYVHAPIAEKAGISADIIAAIRDGRRPARMSDDETIVYDFTSELQDTKRVSDTTFARAEARFGKPAIVDLAAISGYYTLLAMELNAARYPIPKDGQTLPRLPE